MISCVYCRFNALIKELEMRMQNLINSVFKMVKTVEEGVRLLDVFRPMSTQEVSHTHKHALNTSVLLYL